MFSIYKKEVQSFFYTPFAYILTALFMFLFAFVINSALGNLNQADFKFMFPEVFYKVILYFIFLIPILTMRTFADERKNGTEVLLMTSPVNVVQIILGKYLANLTVFLFMIAASTFYPIFTAVHGEVVMGQLICAYVGFFFWGAMYIALGQLVSAFVENSIVAAIIGEFIMFVVLFIDDFSMTDFIAQYPTVQGFLYAFAAQPRFAYFSQGFIRLSDIVFFISAVLVALAWNYIVIEKRRWKRG